MKALTHFISWARSACLHSIAIELGQEQTAQLNVDSAEFYVAADACAPAVAEAEAWPAMADSGAIAKGPACGAGAAMPAADKSNESISV